MNPKPLPAIRFCAQGGFTLVELMVTLVVVALLAGVALPSFMDSVRKSRRADAFAALTAVQQAQERWRSSRNSYTTELTATPTGTPPGLGLVATSAKGYYQITIDSADATNYEITASAIAGTSQVADVGCQRLRIRAVGGNLFFESATPTGTFVVSNSCWVR